MRKNTKVIGTHVLRLRKKSGLTQAELADKAGLNKNTVCWLETGKMKSVQFSTLEMIADVLGVPVARLLKGVR